MGVTPSPVGRLLRQWRGVRRRSQLALALDAGVSARHLSFVESGRAAPSRDMVLRLAAALDVPLRERNPLLLAAGFAPVYRESDLAAPELGAARRALDLILAHQEPYPAVVMNPRWEVVAANGAAGHFFGQFVDLDGYPTPLNVLRLMFDPKGVRPFVVNWDEVAAALVERARREAVGGIPDEQIERLLAEIAPAGLASSASTSGSSVLSAPPFIPVRFRVGGAVMSFFSTVTTLGTPQDVTLQELRIECFFPADQDTDAAAHRLAQPPPAR